MPTPGDEGPDPRSAADPHTLAFMGCPECGQGIVEPVVARDGRIVWRCDEADETWNRAADVGVADMLSGEQVHAIGTGEWFAPAELKDLAPEDRAVVLDLHALLREDRRRARVFGWNRPAEPPRTFREHHPTRVIVDGLTIRSVPDLLAAFSEALAGAGHDNVANNANGVNDADGANAAQAVRELLRTRAPGPVHVEWLDLHVSRARLGDVVDAVLGVLAAAQRDAAHAGAFHSFTVALGPGDSGTGD